MAPSNFSLRDANSGDVVPIASVLYDAFREHNLSVGVAAEIDFPSVEVAIAAVRSILDEKSYEGIVAIEDGGAVVGAGFIQYGGVMNYLLFIAVSPGSKSSGVGKAISLNLLKRSRETSATCTRLVQGAPNTVSFSLYGKLGFRPVEYWNNFVGSVTREQAEAAAASLGISIAGYVVRAMEQGDVNACSKLFIKALGFDGEAKISEKLRKAPPGTLRVITKDNAIVGYTTGFVRSGHLIAADSEAAIALYASASQLQIYILGQLFPLVLHWAFRAGLKFIRHGTIMVMGDYHRPLEGIVCSAYTG